MFLHWIFYNISKDLITLAFLKQEINTEYISYSSRRVEVLPTAEQWQSNCWCGHSAQTLFSGTANSFEDQQGYYSNMEFFFCFF